MTIGSRSGSMDYMLKIWSEYNDGQYIDRVWMREYPNSKEFNFWGISFLTFALVMIIFPFEGRDASLKPVQLVTNSS